MDGGPEMYPNVVDSNRIPPYANCSPAIMSADQMVSPRAGKTAGTPLLFVTACAAKVAASLPAASCTALASSLAVGSV